MSMPMKEKGKEKGKGFAVDYDRLEKARKIERILCDAFGVDSIKGKKVLDIGCGSGHIAEYFSKENEVYGVDVVEQLTVNKDLLTEFKLINSETLPFEDNSFDIVISNHVVAYMQDQVTHISEIRRVLKNDGLAYFACPNRNYPLEPHFKVPFLHYFPNAIFNTLMKAIGKYREPVKLLSYQKLTQMVKTANMACIDYTVKIIRNPKHFNMNMKALPKMPELFKWISPTMVFVLSKSTGRLDV